MKIKLLLSLLAVSATAAADDNRSRPGPPRDNMFKEVTTALQPINLPNVKTLEFMIEKLTEENKQLQEHVEWGNKREKGRIEEIKALKNDLATMTGLVSAHNATIHRIRGERDDTAQERDDFRRIVEYPGSLFKGWVFSEEFGWVFMSPTTAPYAFLAENNEWVCYELGTGIVDGRLVFKFRTNEWVDLDAPQSE